MKFSILQKIVDKIVSKNIFFLNFKNQQLIDIDIKMFQMLELIKDFKIVI